MTQQDQAYGYRPLNASRKETRLLTVSRRLQHIPHDDPVTCSINHVSLLDDPLPIYDTISYVWGDPSIQSTIILDGQQVTIPAFAEQALKCVRLHTGSRDRRLWIDAICIDQNNIDERREQVNMMGDIYRSSFGNLIYLGEDDGTVSRACLDFYHLEEEIRQEAGEIERFLDVVFNENEHTWRSTDVPLMTRIDPEALANFYSRPWFWRVWVIQEIALSNRSTFVCGPHQVSGLIVLRVAIWLEYKESTVPYELRKSQGRDNALSMAYIAAARGMFEGGHIKRAALGYLMALSTRFDATDPRDHIFAILDLLRSSAPESEVSFDLLAPDYRKPYAQVYRDATVFWILHEKTIRIWRNVYHRGEDEIELGQYSSWTPQWHRIFDAQYDAHRMPERFSASLGIEVSTQSLNGPVPSIKRSLILRGFSLARATQVTQKFTKEVLSNLEVLNSILNEIDEIVAGGVTEMTEETHEALANTLVVGDNIDGYNQFRSLLREGKFVFEASQREDKEDASSDTASARRYHQLLIHYMTNRRFFNTDNGYWGTATYIIQPGDHLVILYGAPWPVILRSWGAGEDHQFLTQCYVQSVMHGQAVLERRENELPDQEFGLI